jgi:hypothetical protein
MHFYIDEKSVLADALGMLDTGNRLIGGLLKI